MDEVVVVDGGSTDATVARARAAGARVLSAPKGRAGQMNAGARAVTGEVLLFVHADTRSPPDAAERIAEALADPGVCAGAFRLRFDRRHPLLALFGWCSRIDSWATTFGDQAYFVRRAAFEAVGGFPDQPLLEDVEIRRRLKGHGGFRKLPACAVTSARRFAKDGVLRRQLANAAILALYALGASPERLARLYR